MWGQLDSDSQRTWDQLSDKAKATILKPVKSSPHAVNIHDMTVRDFLTAQLHDQRTGSDGDVDESWHDASQDDSQEAQDAQETDASNDDKADLLAFATKSHKSTLPAHDIRRVLSTKMAQYSKPKPFQHDDTIMVNSKTYRLVNLASTTYSISAHQSHHNNLL